MRPETVEVDVLAKVIDLREKEMIGGGGIRGMVGTLKGVAEHNDQTHGSIGDQGEVQVAVGQLIDLINDQDGSVLGESGFPSGNAPEVSRTEAKDGFPLGTELGGGGDDTEIREVRTTEETGDREGLATTGETSKVDEGNGKGGGGVNSGIKSKNGLAALVGGGRVNGGKNSIEKILHVGHKILCSGGGDRMGMNGAERKEVVIEFELEESSEEFGGGGGG